jgi:putative ABC transport system permease protein
VLVGIVGALIVMRVLQSFLYEVAPTDPLTIAAAGVLLVGVTLVACWVPTWRAAAVDPLAAVRCE